MFVRLIETSCSGVFVVNLKQILHVFITSILLALDICTSFVVDYFPLKVNF